MGKSQWSCLLENLGVWQGSFTRFSPDGGLQTDTPTEVSLEGIHDNQTVRQTIRRFLPAALAAAEPQVQETTAEPQVQETTAEPQVQETILEYSSLGRGVLFFDTGAFSQGSLQWGPFAEFGAEFGFVRGDRRLRLVQLYDRNSQLAQLTLIRERLADATTPERSPLTVDSLIGEWQGEAVTIYPDWRSPDTYPTRLTLQWQGSDRLTQQLTFGDPPYTLTSTGTVMEKWIEFPAARVLLLPDGGSATCPLTVPAGCPFFLEAGWLLAPDLRQRMVRSYDDKGAWVSVTLITEHKV